MYGNKVSGNRFPGTLTVRWAKILGDESTYTDLSMLSGPRSSEFGRGLFVIVLPFFFVPLQDQFFDL
jgi:hypothetical protein